MTASAAVVAARATLAEKSKSFALAGRLLPGAVREDAAVVYAWCRRADDAVDLAPPEAQAAAVQVLRRELDAIYGAAPPLDPLLAAFQEVVRRHGIPRTYPAELIEGMAMDARGDRYETLDELMVYCFRVAGTVGLMMAHVMGVTDVGSLIRAADLGLAMQLTNICRDVAEDWERGRLYLPRVMLGRAPEADRGAAAALDIGAAGRVVAALLARADALYASGRSGLAALPLRCAVAIGAAAAIYRAIGGELARRRYDISAGRAVVPGWKKRLLALGAALAALSGAAALAGRARRRLARAERGRALALRATGRPR